MAAAPDNGPVLNQFRLDDKVAIVTGASSGLGLTFAFALAQAGAAVVLAARRADRLDDAAGAIENAGGRALGIPTDVSESVDCDRVAEGALERFGRIDVLVNAAGISDAVPALRQSDEEFRRVVEVNLHGSFWMARACARTMQPGSSVINVSSALGLTRGDVPSAAYASSKSGLIGLTRDLAAQWGGRRGIRVNALAPGFFLTDLTQPLFERDELSASALSRIPMKRLGEPEELSGALLFLASDASSYVTGITLPVDGGWTMH